MSYHKATYRGKHIVKYEKKNGVTVETYVEFEKEQIFLKTYIDFKLHSSVCIADLTGGECDMIDNINFVSVEKAYPETGGNAAHVYIKCSNGKITKGMYYKNGKKPTFAAYGSEVKNVIAWAYMR